MMTRALCLLALVACADPKDDPPADTAPAETDTDPAASDTDPSDPAPARWDHVVTSIAVASAPESLDLDGDGAADNALAALRVLLNPALAEALSAAPRVLILQTGGVDGATDAEVTLAAFSAEDPNADASDNAGAHFDAGPAVDASGEALISTPTALTAGAYTTVLASQTIEIGAFSFAAATGLHLDGVVDADHHGAKLGVAVRVAPLTEALTAAGKAELAAQIAGLADLDTDGDTAPDAVSTTFLLEAAPCAVP